MKEVVRSSGNPLVCQWYFSCLVFYSVLLLLYLQNECLLPVSCKNDTLSSITVAPVLKFYFIFIIWILMGNQLIVRSNDVGCFMLFHVASH